MKKSKYTFEIVPVESIFEVRYTITGDPNTYIHGIWLTKKRAKKEIKKFVKYQKSNDRLYK